MAIELFQGGSIPRELSSGAMEYLWAKWKALSATGSLSLQRLMEESSHRLQTNSTYMIPTANDDFVFMYVGQAVQTAAGFNPTGQLLSASDTPVARDLLTVYRQVARTQAPSFVRFSGPRNGQQIWQGLVLPIKLSADTVMLVCYSELISHHAEVCEHLFQVSREALLVASPISNELGEINDGWVVMINDAARKLLKFDDSIGNLRLRHLECFESLELRFKPHPPVPAGTVICVTNCDDFEVAVIRFAHVFALRLVARTSVKPFAEETAPGLAPV